jgi:predicted anti-sigma-YlaC factor YlaD
MTHDTCTTQPDILTATAEGRELSASLAAHLASCPSCREQAEAVAFVRGLAGTEDVRHQLPDPAVIWWKAQLTRRWQAERAAAAPIERMRWIELAAGFLSLAVFLAWQWRSLVNLVSRAIPAGVEAAAAAPQAISPTALVLISLGTMSLGAMVLGALHRRLGGSSY